MPLRAQALADAYAVPWLRAQLGNSLRIGPTTNDGRVEVEVRGHHPRSLAAAIAGFGKMLEVVDPPEVRAALADVAAELVDTYCASRA
jgi:predicted DNA-binding transcriptional regulator YafY